MAKAQSGGMERYCKALQAQGARAQATVGYKRVFALAEVVCSASSTTP